MLRWRIEIVVATLLAVLAVITLAWPNWIELVFGADPVGGDGSAEWGTVLVLAAGALIVGLSSAFVGGTLGLVLGVGSAYIGGTVDMLMQRVFDIADSPQAAVALASTERQPAAQGG